MIKDLIDFLRQADKKVYIQPHDFPDPDAVASAYGLQYFLQAKEIPSEIVYCGTIQREALKAMIESMGIQIRQCEASDIRPEDLIIIVDGCKWNRNVTDMDGEEIAVIDHHPTAHPEDVPYLDIRPEYGSCSTIITEYMMEENLPVSKPVATALMVGISRDTDYLTRKLTKHDLDAYNYLYRFADITVVNKFLRNNIEIPDFKYFQNCLSSLNVKDSFAWCYFEDGCKTNLMGIIGDFILSAHEIDFTAVFAKNGDSLYLSFRNEHPEWDAQHVMKQITNGRGAGGGHKEMAGGVIFQCEHFLKGDIINQMLGILGLE